MSKKIRDTQIVVRIPRTLRSALEDVASADERGLSGLVRKVLIDFATRRVTEGANGSVKEAA